MIIRRVTYTSFLKAIRDQIKQWFETFKYFHHYFLIYVWKKFLIIFSFILQSFIVHFLQWRENSWKVKLEKRPLPTKWIYKNLLRKPFRYFFILLWILYWIILAHDTRPLSLSLSLSCTHTHTHTHKHTQTHTFLYWEREITHCEETRYNMNYVMSIFKIL